MKESSIMEIKKCVGCGLILQSDNIDGVGYIPSDKYNDSLYCQRCFRLIHYNKKVISDTLVNNEDIINTVNESSGMAFFLVDFLNISKQVIDIYKKINVKKFLVISKSDLIFDSISKDRLVQNIKDIYGVNEDILFFSSKRKDNINFVFDVLKKKKFNKGFLLGFTNAGKSSLVNILKGNDNVVVSNMPNTTLDFIKLDIDGYEIIDSPGFSYDKTFYDRDDFELIKRVNPKYFVRPLSYQVKLEQIFKIEDKLYLKGFNYNNVIFYMSNLISVKKIYKDDDIKYKTIEIDDNSDLVILGLGFVYIKKKCSLMVSEDYIDRIEVRSSLLRR